MRFDPRPYAEGIRRRNRDEEEAAIRRAEDARAEARILAERIGGTVPGVRRVLLFGSLLADIPKNRHFDIDLAIDGGDVFLAQAIVEESIWDVDVVALDRLPDHSAATIEERGRLLFPHTEGQSG